MPHFSDPELERVSSSCVSSYALLVLVLELPDLILAVHVLEDVPVRCK